MFHRVVLAAGLGFFLIANLHAQDATPPTIVNVSPAPGTVNYLTNITVVFSEPVDGIDENDFLIEGLAVASMSGGGTTYTFRFEQPPYGTVQIGWAIEGGIRDLSPAQNPFDATAPGASWQYQLVDATPPTVASLFPAPGATVRALTQVEVTFSEEVVGVSAADLRVNGQAASTLVKVPGGPFVFQFAQPAVGTVNLSWAPGHGITDISPASNPFSGAPWSYQLNPNATPGDLVITEILAANISTNGLADEDRQQSEWIEIFNRGSNAVNLAGWALSDDADTPGLWVFGSKVLNAGQYMIVFASGKDRRNPTGTNRFHTNFKLSRGGEHLGLYSPDSPRVFVSGFEYPEQRNDYSYGYDPSGNVRYFRTPTPGAANGSSLISGVVEPVHFSVERGHFTSPFDLYLSTPTPKANIRVTFDGSEPTEANGAVFTGSLRVTNNAMIRAAAFRTNTLPSRVNTHTYLFNQSAAVRSLPILSLVTGTNNLIGRAGIIGMNPPKACDGNPFVTNNPATDYHNPVMHGIAWERPVSAEFIRLDGQPGFQVDCGLRVQGSDYQRPRTCPTSKFSFRLYFRSDYGEGRLEYPFFTNTTVATFDQLVLRAGFNDPDNPFIRDELTRRLSADMGQVASHGNLVALFINGQYKGYYNPCERVHEEMLQAHHGGGGEWDVVSPSFASSAEGPGVVDGDRINFNSSLDAYINGLTAQQVTNPTVYQQVTQRLDVVNFVDYCLLNVYCGMGDWPANNFRAGRERSTNGIWRFYVWDGEWSMGIYGRTVTRDTFAENGAGPDNSGLASTGFSEIARIYQSLRRNSEFRLLWADRIHKHYFNNGALTDRNITNNFFALRAEMAGVLPGMALDIPNTWVPVRRGTNMLQFQFYGLLASSNAPNFSQHGGRVPRNYLLTMTSSNPVGSVIYYTTNGVDPRVMFSGAVSPVAVAYDPAGLRLQQNVLIKARTLLNGTNWSALTEASFDVGTIGVPIRITEINYNPPGGGGYEFIELKNFGTAPVDLSGMYFEGVTFTFNAGTILAPGATLVLSSDIDPTGFAARYTNVVVAGRFSGNLANGGERLTLRDRTGAIIISVDYDDENGWPTAADGQGSSLEIIDPFGDPDDPANWRASAQLYGTPGVVTPAPGVAAVRINELMADNLTAVPHGATYPDWIELYNAGGAAVDLGGWSLTDDGNLRKFVFGPGTTIAAGGYLLVWCDSVTNTTPGLHTGFALGHNGETITLYNAATSRVDAVTFGLQVSDYSIGRISGDWQLTAPTPGAANTLATLGAATDLAINEWLANPAPGQPDWVELHNIGAAPVSLNGMYLGVNSIVQQITSQSYVGPGGFAQIFCDENVGPDHLDVKLPGAGATIVLYDAAAVEVTRVTYGAQAEGVSQGRLPNGTGGVTNFAGSMSPGASNYVAAYTGTFINEVMARNRAAVTNGLGEVGDWIELYNPASTNVDLGGMSLSIDGIEPGQWIFPAGSIVPATGFRVIWCENSRAASTIAETYLNTGRNLDGDGGGVYLFTASGQLVNFIEYGPQVEDRSIGRVGVQWRLLANPTPGAGNSSQATLGSTAGVVFNEWMTQPTSGPDWFELYNTNALPVDLSGFLVTDDPSLVGINKSRIVPLSFIGGGGWVRFVADEDPSGGRNHVNFSLSGQGDSIRIYTAASNIVTSLYFGRQLPGVSEGRLPDGAAQIVAFPNSDSPGESNYLLPENIVFNEVLSHATTPLEDAVELYNPSTETASIGGWYLSDDARALKKARIPDGTIIPAGSFAVLYENSFNNGSPTAFSLNRSRGNELWLSQADAAGNLTGVRTKLQFGPALNGVSIGRYTTHLGTEFVSLSQTTFGADNPSSVTQFRSGTGLPNASAKVGPVVINEIMYHPPDIITPTNVINNTDDEFVELHNISSVAVNLSNWRLSNGVNYAFASGVSLPAGGYLLVVSFDPVIDTATLDAFRAKYSLSPSVPIFGPYQGRLDNDGETIELYQPDVPDAGYVPYVLVEKVHYTDTAPWPAAGTDGGGLSMQRKVAANYANEPENWVAGNPSPGSANNGPVTPLPVIVQPPRAQTNVAGSTGTMSVTVSGTGPFAYQWRFYGIDIPGATNATLVLSPVEVAHEGLYDVFVSNAGGTVFTDPVFLTVTAPPEIVIGPDIYVVRPGTNVTFSVTAVGPAPLSYQWRFNGIDIPGATSRTLLLTNVQLEQSGTYEARVTNPNATVAASGTLIVLVAPIVIEHPQSVTAFPGDNVTLRISVYGTTPIGYRWRRSSVTYVPFELGTPTLTLTNVQLSDNGAFFDVILTNRANSAPGVRSASATITVLADNDHDRMGDAWETANGFDPTNPNDALGDADGDGMSNLAEFIAGTNPNDPQSYLKIDQISVSDTTSLQFFALSNKNYTVKFADDLQGGTWSNLAHVLMGPTRTNNRVETVIDSNAVPTRYYRLVTPSQR